MLANVAVTLVFEPAPVTVSLPLPTRLVPRPIRSALSVLPALTVTVPALDGPISSRPTTVPLAGLGLVAPVETIAAAAGSATALATGAAAAATKRFRTFSVVLMPTPC